MKRRFIQVEDKKVASILSQIEQQTDIKSQRIKRLLSFPDLSRQKNSPIGMIVEAIVNMPMFADFDIIQIPEIVSVRDNFDLLNVPLNHPSRKETDTYYVNEEYVLRTQTTVMWPFYLQRDEAIEQLHKEGEIGLLSYGKVFRKDEIDRNHFPVFHQLDGLYICKKEKKMINLEDLQEVLSAITKTIFGTKVVFRFLEDTFPFTRPSTQVEIKVDEEREGGINGREERWLEIVGAGIVHGQVLKNLNINPEVYNGWAFGFGLERLAITFYIFVFLTEILYTYKVI